MFKYPYIYIYTCTHINAYHIIITTIIYYICTQCESLWLPWGKLTSTWKSRSFPREHDLAIVNLHGFSIHQGHPGSAKSSTLTTGSFANHGNHGNQQRNAPNHGGHLWSSFLMMPKVQKETKHNKTSLVLFMWKKVQRFQNPNNLWHPALQYPISGDPMT